MSLIENIYPATALESNLASRRATNFLWTIDIYHEPDIHLIALKMTKIVS